MSKITMKAKDTLAAPQAECFVEISGKRYNFINAIKLEAKMTKKKSKIPILGQPGGGNRATGWEGSGSMTIYYNSSVFRDLAIDYAKAGQDTYFDIYITNEDKTASVGRQTIILKGCNLDEVLLAKFDADGEYLDEEVSFTFEDVSMPEKFATLNGLI